LKYRGSPNLEGGPAGYPAAAFRKKAVKREFSIVFCRKIKKWKIIKKVLAKVERIIYNLFLQAAKKACPNLGLSPNGKATDSDSVISRFESL
jgi:hypothetical protein